MDSKEEESHNMTPFNSHYEFDCELFSHERGSRCGCNIDEKYLSKLNSDSPESSVSYDYEYLLTGGSEGEVAVLKLTKSGDCKIVSIFMAHVNTVMSICPSYMLNDFLDMSLLNSSDGELTLVEHQMCFYTCGRDKLIHRFNLAGKKLLTLEGHDDAVCSLHELQDHTKLVSGSWDGTAIVWNVLTATQEYRIKSDQYKYSGLFRFTHYPSVYVNSLNTGEIVTAMQNGDLCFWNGTKLVNYKKLHQDAIRAVSIRDGYLTCSNDCTVKLHTKSLASVYSFELHDGFVYDVRHSKLFDVSFSSSEDKTVRVLSVKDGKLLQTIHLETSVWQVVETTHNGIATIELSGKVILWKLKPGTIENHSEVNKVRNLGDYNQNYTKTVLSSKLNDGPMKREKILDMTLFKKFNSAKAKELILKYNEENKTLVDREVLYVNEFFKHDLSSLRDSYDVTWVLKLVEWPLNHRLPVFDLIKASAAFMFSEQLFKSRNNGSKILFTANEALKLTDNPQLISVSLQMFSNLLYPSISRSVMFRHYESIFEALEHVSKNNSKLTQQPLSVLCQNYSISCVHNNDSKPLISILKTVNTCLSVCNKELDLLKQNRESKSNEDFQWVTNVVVKHINTLELLLDNFTKQAKDHILNYGLKELMEDLSNKLIENKLLDTNSQKSFTCVLNTLKG